MKKNIFYLLAFVAMLGISACSSSYESDIRKMANYRCQVKKLMAKDPSDEKAKKELEKTQKDMDDFRDKITEKYKGKQDDKSMTEKADAIMDEVMSKCN
jgi:Skp family chaperone for outer membrane proteins